VVCRLAMVAQRPPASAAVGLQWSHTGARAGRLSLRKPLWHVSILHYAFHCERAEGRVLVADLLLRIASDVPPRLDFVHVVELQNDDAVRWGLASYRKGLIEPTSDVFAPIVIDGLLRRWEEVFFVTVLVLDRDFSIDIGGRRCCSMQAVDRASA